MLQPNQSHSHRHCIQLQGPRHHSALPQSQIQGSLLHAKPHVKRLPDLSARGQKRGKNITQEPQLQASDMKSVSFYSLTGLPLLMAGSACCVNKLASRGQAASVLAASSSGSGFSGGGRLQDPAWAVAEMAHSSVHFGLPSHCKVLSISLRFLLTRLSLLSLPIFLSVYQLMLLREASLASFTCTQIICL